MKTIEQFAAKVKQDTQNQTKGYYPKSWNGVLSYCWEVNIVPGRKYTKVDVGRSGKFMVDAKGNIFGIKGYGRVHKGRRYGTLDTIDGYFWGHYHPVKLRGHNTMKTQGVTPIEKAALLGPRHTPGPWKAEFDGVDDYVSIVESNSTTIIIADVLKPDMPYEANARLIATAPDLLEALDNTTAALETCLAHYGQQMGREDLKRRETLCETAREAIAEATK